MMRICLDRVVWREGGGRHGEIIPKGKKKGTRPRGGALGEGWGFSFFVFWGGRKED